MADARQARDRANAQDPSSRPGRRPRIALVNSIVARNDAISASVIDTYQALTKDDAFDVSLFCYRNDYPDLPSHTVSGVNDLLYDRRYLEADLLLWHFGVTYGLFDATVVGNGRAPRVVRFHNVTPKKFVPERFGAMIDRSLKHCHLMRCVEEVWADSTVNAEGARALGVDPRRIHDMPLVVETGRLRKPSSKAPGLVTILFVGRFVPSKGVLDLLSAVRNLHRQGSTVPFRVDLVGNLDFSDPDYVAEVRAFLDQEAMAGVVTMHGTVDDATLADLYADAHILAIPSYHEGFCKPVVEALRAGCVPVGYSAFNVPHVVNGFGRLVPAGDVEALSSVLRDLIEALPKALASPRAALLPLDMGLVSVEALAGNVERYVARFGAERIGRAMRKRVNLLVARGSGLD